MKTSAKPIRLPDPAAMDYQDRIGFLLGAIGNLLANGGSRLFRKAFGLGLGEARLMYVLGYETGLTARRASQIMGVDKGAVSRSVAALERHGLVQVAIDSADNRQRVIQFTRSGRKLRERLMVVALERERQVLSIFSEDEVRTLSALLKRLHTHVPEVRTPKPLPFPRAAATAGASRGAPDHRRQRRGTH